MIIVHHPSITNASCFYILRVLSSTQKRKLYHTFDFMLTQVCSSMLIKYYLANSLQSHLLSFVFFFINPLLLSRLTNLLLSMKYVYNINCLLQWEFIHAKMVLIRRSLSSFCFSIIVLSIFYHSLRHVKRRTHKDYITRI